MENDAATTDGMPETQSNPFVDTSKRDGMELAHLTQEKAGDLVDKAQVQLKSRLNSEKQHVSTSLEHIASAVQKAGQGLRESDQPLLGEYADNAARVVGNFSRYLGTTDVGNFVGDLQTVARKRPAAFIGSLFLLGLVAGRFLKSSGQHATAV